MADEKELNEEEQEMTVTLTLDDDTEVELSLIHIQMCIRDRAGDEDALQKLMQDAVKQYMTKIGEMEPSEEMTELTIKCQRVKVDVSGKEKIAWMPQDLSKFSDEVNNATFKQVRRKGQCL